MPINAQERPSTGRTVRGGTLGGYGRTNARQRRLRGPYRTLIIIFNIIVWTNVKVVQAAC